MRKDEITAAVVAALLAEQFPQWAGLAVTPVELDGWDNATFRLGDELSVRLPSGDAYVAQVDKEHRWLPYLAARLPRPIPEPVARGRPGQGFPRPWSVYRWIQGQVASGDRVGDLVVFATDLAAFLSALQRVDARDGPAPGPHCFNRGGPLAVYDAETRAAVETLAGKVDGAAVLAAWETALAAPWSAPPVWVHGDVVPSNLLVRDGRLAAVIDFGSCAVGDPACDLVMAWNFFDGAGRAAFCAGLDLDAPTWARARGWALWKALVTLARAERPGWESADTATRRFGWRTGALGVLDDVLRWPGP